MLKCKICVVVFVFISHCHMVIQSPFKGCLFFPFFLKFCYLLQSISEGVSRKMMSNFFSLIPQSILFLLFFIDRLLLKLVFSRIASIHHYSHTHFLPSRLKRKGVGSSIDKEDVQKKYGTKSNHHVWCEPKKKEVLLPLVFAIEMWTK